MSQIITIDSSPLSVSGITSVTAGQPIYFYVSSGLSSGLIVTYEWHLVRSSVDSIVGIASGYTLYNPQEDDSVYVNIINCTSRELTGWYEDIYFYYNNMTSGIPEIRYIDLNATYPYMIRSIVIYSDTYCNDIEVQINGSSVIWSGSAVSVDSGPIINEINSDSNNTVEENDIVTLVTSGIDDGVTLLQGKLKIERLMFLTPTTTTTTTV